MKKLLSVIVCFAVLLGMFTFIMPITVAAVGTTYYIDTAGNNSNNGLSSSTPWADFTNINNMTLSSGDTILLKRGCTWSATSSYWYWCNISASNVTVDAYGTGANPKFDGNGYLGCAFYFQNRDNLTFQNIDFANICVTTFQNQYTTYNHSGLTFRNFNLTNAFLYVSNTIPDADNGNTLVSNVVIDNIVSTGSNNTSSIAIGTRLPSDSDYNNASPNSVMYVKISNVYLFNTDDCALVLNNCSHVTLSNIDFNNNCTQYAPQGTTTVFLYRTYNLKFINCLLNNTLYTGSYDQCCIDNEAYNSATTFEGCYSSGNAGASVEFLQLAGRTGDYSSGHVVNSCTFQKNGRPSLDSYSDTGNYSSGTASNNIYNEPSGFTTGNFANWTMSNNMSVSEASNLSNAGQDYTFFGVQGYKNWYYQSYDGSSWSNLSWTSPGYFGSSSSNITLFDTLPDATSTHKIARAYIAPFTGSVQIRGWAFLPYNNYGGDGVRIKITKNGTTIWGSQTIGGSDTSGYATNVSNVWVNVGDIIRFEVDCGSSNNNSYDNVSWIPTVAYTSGGNLLSNPGFESGTTSWTGQNCTIGTNSSAYSGSNACLATSRLYGSSSPSQDITNILTTYGQGVYSFSAWAKLASGSDGMLIVIRTNDSTGDHWFAPASYTNVGTTYTKLSCSTNISWTGTLNSAVIYVQNQNVTTNLYADDFTLSRDGNLLSNAGFESGTASWSGQNCSISASASSHSGSYACLASSRLYGSSSPIQDVKNILIRCGQGEYSFSAWAKLASGSDGTLIVIRTNDSTGDHWFAPAGYTTVGTTYTQLSCTTNITWTGTLNSAVIYVQNQNVTTNLYADDFYMSKS